MRIGLVAAAGRRVDVAHHGRPVAGRQNGRRQSFLQLFLLFAILGAAILEPDLHDKKSIKMRDGNDEDSV